MKRLQPITKTLQWDPTPEAVKYTVYELIGTTWTPIATATTTTAQVVERTLGTHTYEVTATNAAGQESQRSAPATYTRTK